jgi:hypothetical protein
MLGTFSEMFVEVFSRLVLCINQFRNQPNSEGFYTTENNYGWNSSLGVALMSPHLSGISNLLDDM